MTAAALPQMAMLDLAKSMMNFVLGFKSADVVEAERLAHAEAGRMAVAIKTVISEGVELLADLPQREQEVDEALTLGMTSDDALETYRAALEITRGKVGVFDHARGFLEQLDEIVLLARRGGVALPELGAAHHAYGDFVRRAMAARPSLIDLAEDLEDVIASIESANEQGDEPPTPHDEIARRHGLGTHQ